MTQKIIEQIATKLGFSFEEKLSDEWRLAFNCDQEVLWVQLKEDFVEFVFTNSICRVDNNFKITEMNIVSPTQDKLNVAMKFYAKLSVILKKLYVEAQRNQTHNTNK